MESVCVFVFLCHSLDQYQLNAHIIFIARPLFKEPVKQGQLWTEAKFKTWRLRNFCSQRLLSLSPCLISFALFIMYKKNGKHSSESREKTLSFTLLNFGSLRGTTLKPKPEEINIQKSKFAANFRAGERVEKKHRGCGELANENEHKRRSSREWEKKRKTTTSAKITRQWAPTTKMKNFTHLYAAQNFALFWLVTEVKINMKRVHESLDSIYLRN